MRGLPPKNKVWGGQVTVENRVKDMKFTIVMASYLGDYPNAAKDRPKKLERALKSVLKQRYENWELIVIADGCDQTAEIVARYKDPRIKGFKIPKQSMWSGVPRNIGIEKASNEWIVYLDIDDTYSIGYLDNIAWEMSKIPEENRCDWYWVDDITFVQKQGKWEKKRRNGRITQMGRCGTSNLIHKKGLAWWNEKDSYAHDWKFIKNLMKASKNYRFLDCYGYEVRHIPKAYDI